MNIEDRINAFVKLGNAIIENKLDNNICTQAEVNNRWFIKQNIDFALNAISKMLKTDNLNNWLNKYTEVANYNNSKTIGVIMAGNIPLVGFHDFLSVLISGHNIIVKLSNKDNILLKEIARILIDIEPAFKDRISFTDNLLKDFDAIIATGSDNSAKYFDYYFGKYPNIIRKNRTSIAILDGNETIDDFKSLGKDILTYYGLGCRNISKIFVPNDYDFVPFFDSIEFLSNVYQNNKYANNYDYNRSIFLLNQVKHYDNNFLLLTEDVGYNSPISVVYYEFYSNINTVLNRLEYDKDKIQLISSNTNDEHFNFGEAQNPSLNDYADNIDTLKFLLNL